MALLERFIKKKLRTKPDNVKQNMVYESPEAAVEHFENAIDTAAKPYHHSLFWGDRLLTLDKSAGFLSDQAFNNAFKAIRGSHQYDQYSSPNTISWRLHTLVWAAKSCSMLEGDFVECGTFKGDMAWFITQLVDLNKANKQFYLYDTFNGFSEKYTTDEDYPDSPGFIAYANQFYKDPSLYPYVHDRFKDQNNVHVIKGTVPDMLLQNSPEKIAFMHIDLNSPAAEIGTLELLFPRLVSGGMVVFDDYGWKVFYKQKDAEDEFMNKRDYTILELPTGQGLVVKR